LSYLDPTFNTLHTSTATTIPNFLALARPTTTNTRFAFQGRHFDPTGMPDLASAILNALEPMDILTFCHRSFLGIGAHNESKKRARA